MTLERHDAWGSDELQVLYDRVHDEEWLVEACLLLPRRTQKAIEVRMSMLRREAGIVPKNGGRRGHYGQRSIRAQAEEASRKLALALLAVDESTAPALSEYERREADTLRMVEVERFDGPVQGDRSRTATQQSCEGGLQLAFLDGPLFDRWAA